MKYYVYREDGDCFEEFELKSKAEEYITESLVNGHLWEDIRFIEGKELTIVAKGK